MIPIRFKAGARKRSLLLNGSQITTPHREARKKLLKGGWGRGRTIVMRNRGEKKEKKAKVKPSKGERQDL